MAKKPTYEELEQRLKELTKEATKFKQSDIALKESEERYRAIVAAFDGLIYVCSQDYRVEFMNDNFIKRTGYDATGELCYKALHDLDSICPWCVNKQVFRGETVRWEVRSPKDNRWYFVVNTPIYHTNGTVSKQAMILDITSRKQMEIQLRNVHHELEQRVEERTSELLEANKELNQLFQTVTDAIMLFDAETRQFINVNDAALNLYGYTKEEFLQLRHQDITAEPEKSDVSIEQTLKGKLVKIPVRYHKKKDGTIFPAEISASTFILKNRKVLCGIIRDITERIRDEEHIRTLTQELMKAHENERQMISRELHDRVAQQLAAVKIGCDLLLDHHSEIHFEIREKISEMTKTLQKSIETVRDLSYDLRPPVLDEIGLVQTLSQYCYDFSENNGISVDFIATGMKDIMLDFNTEINLYRLVQEGLTNIKKHADASHVTIRLVAVSPNIILRIEDNGRGFDVQERLANLTKEKRMGIRSIEERVKLLRGEMTLRSRPMKGTKIYIKFPYKDKKEKS